MPPFITTLAEELAAALTAAEEVWIAVALVNEQGLDFLQQHTPPTATVRILVGVDLPTPPAALARLLMWKNSWTSRLYGGEATYHPKVYVIRQAEHYVAFIGSANATAGGLKNNVELTAVVRQEDEVKKLLAMWWTPLYEQSLGLTPTFVEDYSKIFNERRAVEPAVRKLVANLKEVAAQEKVTLSLAGQFFTTEHFRAFASDRWRAQDEVANRERNVVRNRLYKLHDQLAKLVQQKKWDLHPHYRVENQVSAAVHGVGVEPDLKAIWLNFGRSKVELKAINEAATPKEFIRLQVILFEHSVETWCRIGRDKQVVDRQDFHRKMRRPDYREQFFEVLTQLGSEFSIQVGGSAPREVMNFANAQELAAFVRPDETGGQYFIIRHQYAPNDPRVSLTALAATVMQDWEKLLPVYNLIKLQSLL